MGTSTTNSTLLWVINYEVVSLWGGGWGRPVILEKMKAARGKFRKTSQNCASVGGGSSHTPEPASQIEFSIILIFFAESAQKISWTFWSGYICYFYMTFILIHSWKFFSLSFLANTGPMWLNDCRNYSKHRISLWGCEAFHDSISFC